MSDLPEPTGDNRYTTVAVPIWLFDVYQKTLCLPVDSKVEITVTRTPRGKRFDFAEIVMEDPLEETE